MRGTRFRWRPEVRPIIHRFSSVTSTQDEARRLLGVGRAEIGHIVIADGQTIGRGRHGRTWLSPAGGLYATYVMDADPLIALRSGLAIARACERFNVCVDLKWPNDVLVDDRKLAGILIEAFDGLALIGVGMNLVCAPIDGAASLRSIGASIPRGELMIAIWECLQGQRQPADLVVEEYRRRCVTLGRPVRVTFEDGRHAVEGTAADIDDVGRLGVHSRSGVTWVSSGECFHLCDDATSTRRAPATD